MLTEKSSSSFRLAEKPYFLRKTFKLVYALSEGHTNFGRIFGRKGTVDMPLINPDRSRVTWWWDNLVVAYVVVGVMYVGMALVPLFRLNRTVAYGVLVLFVTYFPVAIWLKMAYVPMPPPGTVAELKRPFEMYYGNPLAFVVKMPQFEALSDRIGDERRSPFVIFEDGQPLGPPHSLHDDIVKLGGGRFSHWTGEGFIFSTSDNYTPRGSGRRFWIVDTTKKDNKP